MGNSEAPQAQTSLFCDVTNDCGILLTNTKQAYDMMHKVTQKQMNESLKVSFSSAISQNAQEPFDGVTYQDKDYTRLSGQLLRVFEVMKDGRWYGASQLCELANVSPLSITARIRDLRKDRFGKHAIETKRANDTGLFLYRLVL